MQFVMKRMYFNYSDDDFQVDFCFQTSRSKFNEQALDIFGDPPSATGLVSHKNNNKHPKSPQARTRSFETVAGNGVDMITYAFGITLPLGLAILVSSFLIFPLRYIFNVHIIIDQDYT